MLLEWREDKGKGLSRGGKLESATCERNVDGTVCGSTTVIRPFRSQRPKYMFNRHYTVNINFTAILLDIGIGCR